MPPHSSHLLQPLDISCFTTLKWSYSRLMEDYIRLGIHHITKLDFITVYPTAYIEALTASNIHSGFTVTGLVPFNPS
jgi:DDE superfamily endonuclease